MSSDNYLKKKYDFLVKSEGITKNPVTKFPGFSARYSQRSVN